jgi:16S rRNA (guanine527-N7)-methyltransferase
MIGKTIKSGAKELGLILTDNVVLSLEDFAGELLKWNRKINLTSITAEKEVAIKHFVDALFFASHVINDKAVLDIGSGAGIPGIPLAIVRSELKVVSVDAVAKKIQFQRHIARLLELENFEAIHARVESLGEKYAHSFDLITSRAFSSLDQFVRLAAPLLTVGGRMIAMKGPASSKEIAESDSVIKQLGFGITSVINYELPANCGKRCLIEITCCNN